MTRTTFFGTFAVAAAGLLTTAGTANAQYVPGFALRGRPIISTGTYVSPFGGVRTATDTYDPFWGTRTSYRGAVSPLTGATYERRVVASPFGGYESVTAYDPYFASPYYLPYGTGYLGQSVRPAYYGNPQMAAYYNGIAANRFRR